jgi:hypothetical protein
MATRWARVFRGLVASSVAVFVAAFAHVVGGGPLPSVAGVVLAFAFCALASIGLAGRRVSAIRLAATVILSQGVFHLLFLVSGGSATSSPAAGMNMGSAPMTVTGGPAMVEDGWMWLAHGVAAAVTIAALVWGERVFWRLFELVFRVLLVAVHAVRPAQGAHLAQPAPRALTNEFLVGAVSRRGPPAVVVSL